MTITQEETTSGRLRTKILQLQGPILVLGGSGFIGANLFRTILAHRPDVYATTTRLPWWRLEGIPETNVRRVDLLVDSNLDALLEDVKPKTVFDCVAYGAYSFETDASLIYRTNFSSVCRLLPRLVARGGVRYIHAGSSSEYGDNAAGPLEPDPPAPNSDYAVSKIAAAQLLNYYGKKKGLACANLRLYSVYGPMEDASRLIPAIVKHGLEGAYPPLVNPNISRDFIYVDDASEAFIDAAVHLCEEDYGESFNIGSGIRMSIADVARAAREVFAIKAEPVFSMPARSWDVSDWYANATRAERRLCWKAKTDFREGLARTVEWYKALPDKELYERSSKKHALDTRYSVSAIIACYKDNQAIPIMYDRLRSVFAKLNIDYEIIFVNDCSPDDSEEVIRTISRNDRRVIGISHSRNFGSQAAFRSGMEIATKNACVLLDGDLQDPPEVIEQLVARWREGYEVVYGRRIKREAPWHMQIAYKLFYRLFDRFSFMRIPHDAGDFSLIDKRVVSAMLRLPERDLFLRGVRAFVGFKQTGVDYVRPERMFGRTTNSLLKNIGWAKKGILSFSNVPLNMLTFLGVLMFFAAVLLGVAQTVGRIFFPDRVPKGVTTVLLTVMFFGSVNLFAIALVGEYIAKIFEEVKQRPLFIRRNIIRDGEVRPAADELKSTGR